MKASQKNCGGSSKKHEWYNWSQGEKTIAFVKQLEKKLKYSKRLEEKEIEIIMWDERLTTKAAERTLIESDMRREKRKEVIDQLAAVYILQGYLDHIR